VTGYFTRRPTLFSRRTSPFCLVNRKLKSLKNRSGHKEERHLYFIASNLEKNDWTLGVYVPYLMHRFGVQIFSKQKVNKIRAYIFLHPYKNRIKLLLYMSKCMWEALENSGCCILQYAILLVSLHYNILDAAYVFVWRRKSNRRDPIRVVRYKSRVYIPSFQTASSG
jgi:hypothetical protein